MFLRRLESFAREMIKTVRKSTQGRNYEREKVKILLEENLLVVLNLYEKRTGAFAPVLLKFNRSVL